MIIGQCSYPAYTMRPQQVKSNISFPSFCARKRIQTDTFEKETDKFKMRVFSPFSETYCESNVQVKRGQVQTFELKNTDKHEDDMIITYDPSKRGVLWDKKNEKAILVNILKSTQKHYDGFCAYHFLSNDLRKEYGYVEIYRPKMSEDSSSELKRDYPEYGVVGKRIEVLYLKNYNDNAVSGVGKLADKVCAQYCVEKGFEPNVVSYAELGSHVAHYKRGKRFIPPEKGSEEYEFLKYKYGKTDPNIILEELIKESDKSGEPVDLKGWGYLVMYMPKELSSKLIEK